MTGKAVSRCSTSLYYISLLLTYHRCLGKMRIPLMAPVGGDPFAWPSLITGLIRIIHDWYISAKLANTIHWSNVGLMLAHRLRRRTNIKPTLVQCIVLTWKQQGYIPVILWVTDRECIARSTPLSRRFHQIFRQNYFNVRFFNLT